MIIKEKIKLDKKLLVIDLDGTFVSVNTFHKWMKFLFVEELKKFHIISIFKILKTVLQRATKSITHAQMKFTILQLSEKQVTQSQVESFVDSLEQYIHQDILKQLNHHANISVLATAAPLLYAKSIQEKYMFSHVIATNNTSHMPWEENLRDVKKKNLLLLMKEHNISDYPTTIYTDHHDDLPLIVFSDIVYIVNPSETTLQKLKMGKIQFNVLN